MGSQPRSDLDCPADAVLAQLLEASDLAVESHLAECESCRERLEKLSGASDFSTDFSTEALPSDDLSDLVDRLKTGTVSTSSGDISPLEMLAPNGEFGGYRIDGLIGEGGMGLVLLGWDATLERNVAIKVLSPRLSYSRAARERFLREARAAAKIQHENVLAIHAVDSCNDLPFLVLPLIEGNSLQEVIDRNGPLSDEALVSIAVKIARGLQAAHEQGLVHRDVKPANILLEGNSRVWVADFGLARAVEETAGTQEGLLSGTPHFMSPEQTTGNVSPVDARSDLFALGSVLYFASTGSLPFDGESTDEIIAEVRDHQQGSIDTHRRIADGIARLLQKSPDERFQTAEEVANFFEGISNPKAPMLTRRLIIGLAAAMVIAAVVISLRPVKDDVIFRIGKKNFPTLAAAAEALMDGDTIEIEGNGRITPGPISIPANNVTIRRSAPESRVEWFASDPREVMLTTEGSITLEGLRFRQDTQRNTKPIVMCTGPSLVIRDSFFVRGGIGSTAQQFHPPMIRISEVISTEIENTMIIGHGSCGIARQQGFIDKSSFSIKNCILWTSETFSMKHHPDVTLDFAIEDTMIFAKYSIFTDRSAGRLPITNLNITNSLVAGPGPLLMTGNLLWNQVPRRFRFSATNSDFRIDHFYRISNGGDTPRSPQDFAEWEASWPSSKNSGNQSFTALFFEQIAALRRDPWEAAPAWFTKDALSFPDDIDSGPDLERLQTIPFSKGTGDFFGGVIESAP